MKTSIRSRLFLITYGIILLFIVGLIVLNNTFLEAYYTENREQALTSAFNEVVAVDLTTDVDTMTTTFLAIETDYNIRVQVLKQNPYPDLTPPFDEDLPEYVTRIFGDRFSIRGSEFSDIITSFTDYIASGQYAEDIRPVSVSSDESYVAFFSTIVSDVGMGNNSDRVLLALSVAQEQADGLYLYYIMTVSIQSISASIAIFNTFTIFVGVLFMILSGIFTYLYSNRFTHPILQMTEVTRDLANLNFEKKVHIKSHDELGVLGDSINKMSDQLEVSIKDLQSANEKLAADIELKNNIDTMRKEFIANASHELKTPISLIIGYSEALRLPDLPADAFDEYLSIIDDEANRMNKLVMSLLKISQLETGFQQLAMEEFSIRDLAEETAKLFSIKFSEKIVSFSLDVEDCFINSDYDSLQTVLTNYLSNAINHIDYAKIIRVTSERVAEDTLRINVFNTGNPIPEDSVDRIWESFYKVDKARTRAYGGQGLGLSIVKITLENLGYSYGVKNLTDGVVFYFEVPIIK